jgi:hypothetical protein
MDERIMIMIVAELICSNTRKPAFFDATRRKQERGSKNLCAGDATP